ncbi:MAG: molecular chaperone TorD family protein [Thiomargarita sp.]|nr:molecular chaperone TorD family protein [Thiomargarita sp.]
MDAQELRIFSLLLAVPNQESISILEEIVQENNWLNEAIEELKNISLESWQVEHTRLFVNGNPTACPPFESVYRSKMMNGPAVIKLEKLYQQIGLEVAEDIPADYLGIILECAAYLLEQKTSIAETNQYSETLWQEHLIKWLPKFVQDLQEQSKLIIYQQLAVKLKELL